MRFVAEAPPHIHGPEAAPTWWTVLACTALALAVLLPLVTVLLRRRSARRATSGTTNHMEDLRRDTLASLGELEEQWRRGASPAPQTVESASRLVRRFVSVATDSGVAALTLRELRTAAALRPELVPVAELCEFGYHARFASEPIGPNEVTRVLSDCRSVVEGWTVTGRAAAMPGGRP